MPEETKKEEPTASPPKAEEVKPQELKKAAEKSAVAKNCVQCNKPIKKKGGYYRHGKYYCNKRCFKLSKAKAAGAVAAA